MVKSSIIELVTDGGMIYLKEIPGQEKVELKNKYFDQFTTYAPFKWLGSRRLSAKEIKEQIRREDIQTSQETEGKTSI